MGQEETFSWCACLISGIQPPPLSVDNLQEAAAASIMI